MKPPPPKPAKRRGCLVALVLLALDRRAAELRVSSLSVMFRGSIPVRSSIVARFGADGRLLAIEGPIDWAD